MGRQAKHAETHTPEPHLLHHTLCLPCPHLPCCRGFLPFPTRKMLLLLSFIPFNSSQPTPCPPDSQNATAAPIFPGWLLTIYSTIRMSHSEILCCCSFSHLTLPNLLVNDTHPSSHSPCSNLRSLRLLSFPPGCCRRLTQGIPWRREKVHYSHEDPA